MDLFNEAVRADLFNAEHPIYTKVKDEAPTRYGVDAKVKNSLLADGCIVEGSVENCILFRGVHVGQGTSLKNCIVMQASEIRENCALDYVILDKGVQVRPGRHLAGYEGFPVTIRKGALV